MIEVKDIRTWGFDTAVHAMRNPLDSWDKSDSKWKIFEPEYPNLSEAKFVIGKNDLELMRRLYKAGSEHRTYARMILCSMDINAPMYFWKEADRYTVGKSQVSCSTMHTIHKREFTVDDFSHEHLGHTEMNLLHDIIELLNCNRELFIEEKEKCNWWQMIQLLPSSYNQRRTICMSYEVVFKIIRERTGHKLDEWNDLIKVLKALPYIKEIME